MNYQEYIASEAWRLKRQQRLEIDKFECRLCGEKGDTYRLEVHHKPQSYARIPYESVEDDLTTLCARCHVAVTDIIRGERYGSKVHTVETIEVRIERKIINVEASAVQIDLIGPVDHAQRTVSQPPQQVGQVDEADHLKEEQDGRRSRGDGPD